MSEIKVELPHKAFERWQKIINNKNIAHAIYFFETDPLQDYINYEVLAGLNNKKFRDEYCEDDAVLSFAKFCFQGKYNLQLLTEEEDKTSFLRRMIFVDLLKAFLIFPNHIENMVSLYKIYGIIRIHSGLKLYTECSKALKKAYLLPLDDDDCIIETTSLPKINNLLETRIYKNFKNDKNPLITSCMYDCRTFDEIVKYIIKLKGSGLEYSFNRAKNLLMQHGNSAEVFTKKDAIIKVWKNYQDIPHIVRGLQEVYQYYGKIDWTHISSKTFIAYIGFIRKPLEQYVIPEHNNKKLFGKIPHLHMSDEYAVKKNDGYILNHNIIKDYLAKFIENSEQPKAQEVLQEAVNNWKQSNEGKTAQEYYYADKDYNSFH